MTVVKRGLVRNKGASREIVFLELLKQAGLPHPHREYRFAEPRKWRADYCWPQQGVALEVEGGVWRQGRHTRGSGFVKDMEKYNAYSSLGFRLFRVTPQQLCTRETIDMLDRALGNAGEVPAQRAT